MLHCDINCDMGEEVGNDELIIGYITSANIACGNHAGDESTMRKTILMAQKHDVNIGAHPSFSDRGNFGRTEINLSASEVYELIIKQVSIFKKIAFECNAQVHHVKPHGALYNMAAKNKSLAQVVSQAIWDCDNNLILYGLSNSFLISQAKAIGLKTASEVFADRTYQDDGSLTARNKPNALIENAQQLKQQVINMVRHGKVKTVSGIEIPIVAETICLHGDGTYAVEFAKAIHDVLK